MRSRFTASTTYAVVNKSVSGINHRWAEFVDRDYAVRFLKRQRESNSVEPWMQKQLRIVRITQPK
jgi:hypothetical protein